MKRVDLLFTFLVLTLAGRAQEISLLDSIRHGSALDLYLTLDWKTLEKQKKEKAYLPAQVSLVTDDLDTLYMPAKVRTRGHMRLNICSFPPLKLKFDKSDLAGHDLSPQNEMDIVHHCHESDHYDQYLLREYLSYKLWELVSPYGFRTQLVNLHYQKEDNSEAHQASYAFLVENTDELAERLGGRRNKTAVMSQTAVDRLPLLRVALFEFMIGNTDWFIQNRHNLEFVVVPGHNLLVPIPYDFDYSGLVNAPYAVHHESIELPSVEIRYYQGWCYSEEEVSRELQIFKEQKQNILSLPYKIEGLDDRSIQYVSSYLRDFYDIIENPKKLQSQVIKHCDMWPVKN